jgi:competence protein ComEC
MYGGVLTVLQEMKVKNIIIGKQFEESSNLEEFMEIVNSKKINVKVVEAGNRVNIEKNLYFDVLWPDSSQAISENSINNNALVCKLNYITKNNANDFSMLFTGDIEEESEKILVGKYKDKYVETSDGIKSNVLQSTILKVAHHGSKSSSTEEFLNLVNPKIALIGVGENNLYGHPAEQTLERLKNLRC